MSRKIALAAALVMGIALSPSGSYAQSIDKNGKCHDATGKFAKMEVCENVKQPAQQCRDKTTKKFAKCDAANVEPVPKAAAPK